MILYAAALAAAAAATHRCDYAGPALHPAVESAIPAQSVADAPLPPDQITALTKAFETAQARTKAPALGVGIASLGGGMWTRATLPQGRSRLYWASAGKTLVAVVIMQLVEEGKVSLDDRLARWVPEAPNAKLITVRDLLAHTSGLFSANEDKKWNRSRKVMSDRDELAILNKHGALFCPGAAWRYSNSNYSMLGRIITAVDGRSWQDSIRARIIDRLALKSMVVVDKDNLASIAPPAPKDKAATDMRVPGPAGPVASNAADMLRFWAALLDGELIGPASRDAMFATLYPMFDKGTYYGLGAMVFDVADGATRLVLLGHAGGMPGLGALVAYSPRDKALVAVSLTGNGSAAPAVANLMLKSLHAPPTP